MRKTTRAVAFLMAGGLTAAAPLAAQRVAPIVTSTSTNRTDSEALERYLFTPELIMRHYREIGLEPGQRETITRAVEELQVGLVDLQWRLMEATQQLEDALSGASIDEQRAVALVDQVLAMEREVKTRHLTALIRIKNALTEEQQDQLSRFKRGVWTTGGVLYEDRRPLGLPVDTTTARDTVGAVPILPAEVSEVHAVPIGQVIRGVKVTTVGGGGGE